MIKYFYFYERKYRITDTGEITRCEYNDVRVQCYNNRRVVLRRNNKERKVIVSTDRNGYKYCKLYSKNHKRMFRIHHLVYLVFVEDVTRVDEHCIDYSKNSNYMQVNHIDGDKSNNHYSNLELVTLQENIEHAVKNKLHNSQINAKYVEIYRYGNYITTIWKTREVTKYIQKNYGVCIDKGTISRRARDGKVTKLGFSFKYKV